MNLSLQVLESSSDRDHADGNVECRCTCAAEEVGDGDSNAICLNAPRASHGVAQVTFRLQVASQGTGRVNVRNSDMTTY
jgi:hypothetical protein